MKSPTQSQSKKYGKDPAKEANDQLQRLFEHKYILTEKKPSLNDFYPVDLKTLLESILKWEIDFVDVAGFSADSPTHENLDAITIFDQKKVWITSRTEVFSGRVNFSIAHEIGHILLHGENGINLIQAP